MNVIEFKRSLGLTVYAIFLLKIYVFKSRILLGKNYVHRTEDFFTYNLYNNVNLAFE